MKLPLATALEHYSNLENRKKEIVDTIITHNLDTEQLQSFVSELKDVQKKMNEIYDAEVDGSFLKQ